MGPHDHYFAGKIAWDKMRYDSQDGGESMVSSVYRHVQNHAINQR